MYLQHPLNTWCKKNYEFVHCCMSNIILFLDLFFFKAQETELLRLVMNALQKVKSAVDVIEELFLYLC